MKKFVIITANKTLAVRAENASIAASTMPFGVEFRIREVRA